MAVLEGYRALLSVVGSSRSIHAARRASERGVVVSIPREKRIENIDLKLKLKKFGSGTK